MERRRFLLAAGTGALTALAGCQTAVGSVAPPQIPADEIDEGGFTRQSMTTDQTVFEDEYGPVTVEAVASSVTYADTELSSQVAEDTLGAIDANLSLFTATRIDMAPAVDELGPIQGEVESRIEQTASSQLRSRLQEAGLEDIEQTNTGTLTVAGGTTADLTEFRGTYPVEEFAFPVQEGRELTIEGTDLPVAALLAVWAAGESYLVSGGAYPAANFAQSTSSDLSDAISVSVDIDLGLTPEAYREELLGLITGVR